MDNKDLQLVPKIEMKEIHTICRLCASQDERFIGIFSEEGVGNDLSNKINLYLPVKVAVLDELPLQCCLNCASTITEKQIIENVVYDNVANPPSDDNDG
jgi:hypothetical protein